MNPYESRPEQECVSAVKVIAVNLNQMMTRVISTEIAAALVIFCTLAAAPGWASPIISEVYYDAPGSDNGYVFVELYGTPGSAIDGLTLEGVNGANGVVGPILTLSGVFPADGLLVIADVDSSGVSFVPDADLLINFDFQNGPDSVRLMDGIVELDAVGYGIFSPSEFFAGEGVAAPDAPAGSSIARIYADLDTDDNSIDFEVLSQPTPGDATISQVPEPSSGLLSAIGLVILAKIYRHADTKMV